MRSVVARFLDQPRAELARGRLLTEGIESDLQDHYIVGVNWLYSTAVGGVKLEVADGQAAEAVQVLATEYGNLLEDDGSGRSGCEACGGELVAYDPLRVLAALTLLPGFPLVFLVGLPFIDWQARWRCSGCRRKSR